MLSDLTEREFDILKIILSQGLLLGIGGLILFLLQQRISSAHARSKARYEQSLSTLSELVQRIDQIEQITVEFVSKMHGEIRSFESQIYEHIRGLIVQYCGGESLAPDDGGGYNLASLASSTIDIDKAKIDEIIKWSIDHDKQMEKHEELIKNEEQIELKIRHQLASLVREQFPILQSSHVNEMISKGDLDIIIFCLARDTKNFERNVRIYSYLFALAHHEIIFKDIFNRINRHVLLLNHFVLSFNPESIRNRERDNFINLTRALPDLAKSLAAPHENLADYEVTISYQCAAMRLLARQMVTV